MRGLKEKLRVEILYMMEINREEALERFVDDMARRERSQ